MRRSPHVQYHAVLPRNQPPSLRSFLRSVGLKILTLHEGISGINLRGSNEQEQVVVSDSTRIALIRLAVHILPVLITLFVFCINAIEILNGPQINVGSTFFLQVAAKFHELTITGSLTVVVLDIIRHELLHEGINLGLLVSGYSLAGVNFLWSAEMLSLFKASYARPKKLWLYASIATCCVLLTIVGPSSALLFIPIQVWKLSGGTTFYLGSTTNDLWPSQLTAQHAGPEACREPRGMTQTPCPAGGFDMIAARVRKGPQVGYTVFLQDAYFTRVIQGWTPRFNYSWDQQLTQEAWVAASRGDVSFMLQDLNNVYHDAQIQATGRSRRLRDFVDGRYMIIESRIPVGRTVCGPAQFINNDTKTIPLPVLDPDRKWRNISFGSNQVWGRTADIEIKDLVQASAALRGRQALAKWTALGPEFGAATAGLVVLSRNVSHVVGRGCTLDYRWALGQTYHGNGESSGAFVVHVGKANTPSNSENSYVPPAYRDFLDPTMIASYSDTIKAGQDWLDAVFPIYSISDQPDGYNMTTFEAMINPTILQDPSLAMTSESSIGYLVVSTMEYIAGVAFVDVLARTNWYKSLKYPDDSMIIDPVLQQYLPSGPQPILTNRSIFEKPDNISITSLQVQWYAYGTTWTLHEPGQFLAVAVLSVYVLIALLHSAVTVVRGTSTEAWDSILELVLLAWNSVPTRRDDEFKNASVGIHQLKTVTHKVKVVVVGKKQGDANGSDSDEGRVELVVVDGQAHNVDGRASEDILPGEVYK